MHGEMADRSARKAQRLHHEGIGRDIAIRCAAGQGHDRAVAERLQVRIAKRLDEHRIDQRGRRLAARTMGEGDHGVAQPRSPFAERARCVR